jgi:hypothetical protein
MIKYHTNNSQESKPAIGQSFSPICKCSNNFFTTMYNMPATGKLYRVVSSCLELWLFQLSKRSSHSCRQLPCGVFCDLFGYFLLSVAGGVHTQTLVNIRQEISPHCAVTQYRRDLNITNGSQQHGYILNKVQRPELIEILQPSVVNHCRN